MHLSPPRIETRRLVLRKLRLSDAENYYRYLWGDPAIAQYMLWEPHKSLEESSASIQKVLSRYEAGTSCRWSIARREDDHLIGIVELLGFDEAGSCSFAYMLGQSFQGQGYGTEALSAAFDYAFQELGIQQIHADHFTQNAASGAVMCKAGMHQTGITPGKYKKDGILHDAIEYEITKEMWAEKHSV